MAKAARPLSLCRFVAILSSVLSVLPAFGAERPSAITRELHPWGRFSEEAWKRYRLVTENFEGGKVTSASVTETKTTLRTVEPDGVTLLFEATTVIAGKRLASEPSLVKYGFHGEPADGKTLIHHLASAAEVTVGRRTIPCQVEQIETSDGATKTVTKIFFSQDVSPYVLRRESVTTDLEGHGKLSDSVFEVLSLDMPCKVLNRVRQAAHIQVVTTHAKGTTKTYAYTSVDVPGGIICQVSYERDVQGQLVRQSTLELIDYGFEPEPERPGLFQRWRTRHTGRRAGR